MQLLGLAFPWIIESFTLDKFWWSSQGEQVKLQGCQPYMSFLEKSTKLKKLGLYRWGAPPPNNRQYKMTITASFWSLYCRKTAWKVSVVLWSRSRYKGERKLNVVKGKFTLIIIILQLESIFDRETTLDETLWVKVCWKMKYACWIIIEGGIFF